MLLLLRSRLLWAWPWVQLFMLLRHSRVQLLVLLGHRGVELIVLLGHRGGLVARVLLALLRVAVVHRNTLVLAPVRIVISIPWELVHDLDVVPDHLLSE